MQDELHDNDEDKELNNPGPADKMLAEELRRRGWEVKATKTTIVEL